MKIRVLFDKGLFDRYKLLSIAIDNLKSIVQNDMYVTQRQFAVWKKQAQQAENELRSLIRKTIEHIEED